MQWKPPGQAEYWHSKDTVLRWKERRVEAKHLWQSKAETYGSLPVSLSVLPNSLACQEHKHLRVSVSCRHRKRWLTKHMFSNKSNLWYKIHRKHQILAVLWMNLDWTIVCLLNLSSHVKTVIESSSLWSLLIYCYLDVDWKEIQGKCNHTKIKRSHHFTAAWHSRQHNQICQHAPLL